jgi:hypothetical protein
VPLRVATTQQEPAVPMRSELALPPTRSLAAPAVRSRDATSDSDAWAVVCFCLIGLAMSLYFAFSSLPIAELPVLVVQYNLG